MEDAGKKVLGLAETKRSVADALSQSNQRPTSSSLAGHAVSRSVPPPFWSVIRVTVSPPLMTTTVPVPILLFSSCPVVPHPVPEVAIVLPWTNTSFSKFHVILCVVGEHLVFITDRRMKICSPLPMLPSTHKFLFCMESS